MIEAGTTGLRTWTAAFFLAQYLLQNPDIVLQKRVLELGSGIGFTGIVVGTVQVLSQAQGSPLPKLWLTDVDETVLSVCRRNVDLSCNLSSLHGNIQVARIDWFDALNETSAYNMSFVIREQMDPELIIGSDIVFDPSLIKPLLSTLKLAITDSNRTALFALTMRNETTMSMFLSSAQSMGFMVEELAHLAGSTGTEEFLLPNVAEDMSRVKLLKLYWKS
ncbi:hypothetical protein EST38_g8819 [Candolleomyces aberdarensis]|uniref:Uncharacterized protein n=1 Tax=Candolleomyces aberdarensis TaxID=2316362 RepID=A0A4Q2DBP9_9AGAR|nr:hypothetical protein EST38_g8819 [Candolleomyces aberdarensis]